MVPIAELLFLLVAIFVGARWYLRTPTHRARKNSAVHPPQVAGHMGFGMYTASNPTLLPRGLHDHRNESRDEQEPEAYVTHGPGDV
ncbi:MAG TPA: hypothetical protein VMT27_01935 [Actinomycetes bacterium]|nr:hypothetical protein [Actinomycetes bacterium]